jgi:hypothetical protein
MTRIMAKSRGKVGAKSKPDASNTPRRQQINKSKATNQDKESSEAVALPCRSQRNSNSAVKAAPLFRATQFRR